MIILMMDDNQDRHDQVDKYLGKEHSIVHTYGVDDNLAAIEACGVKIGLALLDHDLQEFVLPDGIVLKEKQEGTTERTGLDFVRKLLQLSEDKYPTMFLVHSNNYEGARRMTELLAGKDCFVRHIPFSIEMLKRLSNELREQ